MPTNQTAPDGFTGLSKAAYMGMVQLSYSALADFASRYGIDELHEPPIDLPAVLRRLHEVVQEQAAALRKATRAAEAVRPPAAAHGNGNGAAVDPLRELRLRNVTKADLDIAERRGQLVEREAVRTALTEGAVLMRQAAERLQRRFGSEAALIYNDMLDRLDVLFAERFAGDANEAEELL